MRKLSKNSVVYLVELKGAESHFKYKGFQDISQLGQYFTLTLNNKKTRLYTSVNCMNSYNRALMANIAPEMIEHLGTSMVGKDSFSRSEISESLITSIKSNEKNKPLLEDV